MSASRLARGSLLATSQARPHRLICRTFVGHRQRRQPPAASFRRRPSSSSSSQTVCIPHRYPFSSFRRSPRRCSPRRHLRQEALRRSQRHRHQEGRRRSPRHRHQEARRRRPREDIDTSPSVLLCIYFSHFSVLKCTSIKSRLLQENMTPITKNMTGVT